MAEQQDQFYVEPQQEHVRQVQELQLPQPLYDKASIISEDSKNIALKMIEIPKQTQYVYQRFQFEKNEQSDQDDDNDDNLHDYQSPFLEFYSKEQLVYKKYNNENVAKFKDTFYFSGCFLHQNIFNANQSYQNASITDVFKDYYEISSAELPQQNLQDQQLKFDSEFESGNLFAAFKISNSEYDLVMQNDTNSRGNNQWFYFSVEKMLQGKQYTFNVVNFTKSDSLFNYGMQPAVYSQIEGQKIKDIEKTWKRMGLEVSYRKHMFHRQNSKKYYYKLSFKLISKHSGDKIFIAHSYPYTHAKLLDFIQEKCLIHKQIVTKITIGKTLSKRPIEILKISNPYNKKKDTRKAIIIMSRQHPGQTQGSFVCQGVIEKILSKTKQGDMLRKNYVIYVIPMVNIDGVIYGHYRTNLSGKDLNRKWDSTQKQISVPQVNCIKAFLADVAKQRTIRFILDLHGHSKKLNSFFYGNPCNENPESVRIYPFICSKLSKAIQFYDCTFSSEQYKRRAARVYLSYLYKLLHVYTFESSFYAYFKDGKKIEFIPKQYRDLGGTLIESLSIQLQHQMKSQLSFDITSTKGFNKQLSTSPFMKYLTELKQNKGLMEIGNAVSSGSDSKPEEGQIDEGEIETVAKFKLEKPASSIIIPEQQKSIKLSRKGQRQIKQINRPVKNMRFLQISKINSVLPDKYQLCLQPIKNQTQLKMNQTLKSSLPSSIKQSSEVQTQNDQQDCKYKDIKKTDIQTVGGLSSSWKIEAKEPKMSNQKRYSSVIRTQNRNNIIFKIDFLTQQSRQQKVAHIKKLSKTVVLKHAFSQTIISFDLQRQLQKQRLRQDLSKSQKIRSSQTFLPSVQSPERQERKWGKHGIKYDTVRIGTKREAEIYLNGIVKKYLVDKQPKQQPLSIFTKALERPKSLRKNDKK